MNEVAALTQLLQQKSSLTAMVAPSFPIMYSSPEIVGKLKRLGFTYVVEVAKGADKTNQLVIEALKADPKSRFITAPCPSIVRMVRSKFPQLEKYLAMTADSPMVATTKLVRQKYPGYRPVFIGPCNVKKLEASEDYPELEIISITFRQLNKFFSDFQIIDDSNDRLAKWDIEFKQTRLYPISGGLAQSSFARDLLADDRMEIISGWQQAEEALKRFEQSDKIRLLDVLFCEGGCINGPGLDSPLSLSQRREKVVEFWGGGSGFSGKIKKMFSGK